ncbi:unnamed protein product, partial [Medioppia subpectinata]
EHKHELHKVSLAMESDEGTFSPHGLTYSGSNPIGKCIMSEILKMLAPLNSTNLYPETKGPDIGELMQKGVPGSHIQTHNEHYFYFHHTNGDTMTVMDTDELDRNTAVITATAYAVASIDTYVLSLTIGSIKCNPKTFDDSICDSLPKFTHELREEIRNLSTDVNKIIDFVMTGADRGVTYDELAVFIDKFGSRFVGTANLENSIDYMLDRLTREGHDIVGSEKLSVPIWQRGKEWAQMVSPFEKKLNILGLGYSVGTNGRVLRGDVVVVKSFDELKQRSHEVKGKFVVFNYAYESYNTAAPYRLNGASEAAKYGAIAALIRSVTDFSIDSPHTGANEYKYKNAPKIPAVSITVEDAELFGRLCAR